MPNYDFLILSPFEFENLSRDLLQKELSVFIESFTPGRDSGIDLRYTKAHSGTTIIQAKRYEQYRQLLTTLKKEVKKVKKLNPTKYILVTSVGLTPANKNQIKTLFSPFILSTYDIIGRNDLNNLLGKYPDIEQQHYKLWLASATVLKRILHSKIYNQSAFELESIKEVIKRYVQNDSFNEAVRILNEHHHVIISGLPGVGKTTLSRILILHLLSNGYKEFVYLSDTIDEGYEFFNEDKSQVFFFDDFLGKSDFIAKQDQNADEKIIKFIEKIRKTPNKRLIMSTREYILKQAMVGFESFSTNNIEIAKCIVDLSSYTNLIKAQILYSHLYFSKVPETHLRNLIENRNYKRLVEHKNYNPRIIETIINRKVWEHCLPEDFSKVIASYFDNPESVWLHAFENSLNRFSQYCLLVLLTTNTPVLLEDLGKALNSFLRVNSFKYFTSYDSILFNKAIRELENTFIITRKDSYGKIAVEYQNPSIHDFLINYLKEKEDLIQSLLSAIVFYEQFFTIFRTSATDEDPFSFLFPTEKIELSEDSTRIAAERLVNDFSGIRSCTAYKSSVPRTQKFRWQNHEINLYKFLKEVYENFGKLNDNVEQLVYREFQKVIKFDDAEYFARRNYISLLKQLDLTRFEFNEEEVLNNFLEQINSISGVEDFCEFKMILPTTYSQTIRSSIFEKKLGDVIEYESTSVEDSDIETLIEKIQDLEVTFDYSYEDQITELKEMQAQYDAYLENQVDRHLDEIKPTPDLKAEEENREIEKLFISLIDNK